MTDVKQINGRKFYTCYEIAQLGLIPGIKTPRQAIELAKADKLGDNYLDAVRVPRGENGVQYQIKGSNIIRYLVNRVD